MEVYTPDARLTAALQEISDTLTAEGLRHLIEPTEENPLCYVVTCYDGYRMNSGFVGISVNDTLSFAAYDPVRGRHDENGRRARGGVKVLVASQQRHHDDLVPEWQCGRTHGGRAAGCEFG
jgi:hypothetical protein